jgi:hypothetical protein
MQTQQMCLGLIQQQPYKHLNYQRQQPQPQAKQNLRHYLQLEQKRHQD